MTPSETPSTVHRVGELTEQLREENAPVLDIVERLGGFVPNGFLAVAWKPNILEALTRLSRQVLIEPGGVSHELRWLVANMASRTVGCRYCWAHTGHNATNLAGADPAKIEAIWEYRTSPLFDDGERAALDFAAAAAAVPNGVTEEVFGELRTHFDDTQIVELMSVIALFGWFNRWNDSMVTTLEQGPLDYGRQHLAAGGWDPGTLGGVEGE